MVQSSQCPGEVRSMYISFWKQIKSLWQLEIQSMGRIQPCLHKAIDGDITEIPILESGITNAVPARREYH